MLPIEDWLDRARGLAVGMRVRVRHGHERRANLTIANERDRWWAHCQACKESGVVSKEHVMLSSAPTMHEPSRVPPDDRKPLRMEGQLLLARWLAAKGMDYSMMPELWHSALDKRLLFRESGYWHGRDLTDRSVAKWMHYGCKFAGDVNDAVTVVTEDLFSMFKVRYALRDVPGVAVACTLGAAANDVAVYALRDCQKVLWAYDADGAGDTGFESARRRMRPFGGLQLRCRPPEGLDPKDMDCASIRNLVKEVLCV